MQKGVAKGGTVLLLLMAPLCAAPSYNFPPPRPFAGTTWFNPYAGWTGSTLKVNLHAHSRAWGGLTAGVDSPQELAQAYAGRGYDALAISNYHTVSTVEKPPLTLVRAYEHGLNLAKSHRLVLGPDDWAIPFDFPVSTRSLRQLMLDFLRQSGSLVGLNHPALQGGHDCDDVSQLTGFDLIEVHNPYASSHHEWDCALSAGRLAWVVGNDDAHEARDVSIGVAWNRIEAARSEGAILEALRRGRSYAVRGEGGVEEVALVSAEVSGETLSVTLSGPATVEWVGDEGKIRFIERDIRRSVYRPRPEDHYLRVVIRTPRTEMLLNPFVRSGEWSAPVVSVNWPLTAAGWGVWLLGAALVARAWPTHGRLRLVRNGWQAA